jgi:dihydroxyacetone kinase-like predicted kinase
MSLQHSDRVAEEKKKPSKPHKLYGVVTVATGDGMCALFESLGADVIINGGQTGNPSAEQFLEAFESIDADRILVFPNNGNILLTATQAASLWKDNNVTVIPTKTLPEGYAALSVFNPSVTELDEQISDLLSAKNAVVSGEITVAIKDSHINGMSIAKDEYIGILQGEIVASNTDAAEALCAMLEQIEDIEDRELITLFTGEHISDDERVRITELLEDRFDEMSVEVYVGGQEIYDYLIAVE